MTEGYTSLLRDRAHSAHQLSELLIDEQDVTSRTSRFRQYSHGYTAGMGIGPDHHTAETLLT